jgi:hypothetical protein
MNSSNYNIETVLMSKIYFILFIFLLLSFAETARRRFRGRGSGGKTGAVLGSAVVNIIKDLREKPKPLPKGYKREVERPEVEEYTLWYKVKQGFKNFQYLAYIAGSSILMMALIKLFQAFKRTYTRYKISQLPLEEQEALLN